MSAKQFLTVSAVVLVAVIYYYLYRDSFSRSAIQIRASQRQRVLRTRPGAARPAAAAAPEEMLVFGLGQDYRLTEIQVVPLAALKTNKYPHPLWHMISESNSPAMNTFIYGRPIRGMHSKVPGAPAEPLSPATGYRVMVTAGGTKGQHDFQTPAEEPAGQ